MHSWCILEKGREDGSIAVGGQSLIIVSKLGKAFWKTVAYVSASERPNEIWLGVRIGVQNSKGLSYLLEGSAVAKAAWWRTAKDNEGTVHSACATSVRAWALRDRHIAICPEFCCQPWVTVNRMADRRKSQVGKP